MRFAAPLLLLLLTSTPARAEGWSAGVGAGQISLGGKNPTGGLLTYLEASRRVLTLSERISMLVGMRAGMFGLEDDPHWFGYLATPGVGIDYRQAKGPWSGQAWLTNDSGLVPIINDWGLAMRYVIYLAPGARLTGGYALSEAFDVSTSISARYINTAPRGAEFSYLKGGWSGVSVSFDASGRFRF